MILVGTKAAKSNEFKRSDADDCSMQMSGLVISSAVFAKELSESFNQLNELLSAAGFLKFSNDTLEELKLRLPSKEGQESRRGSLFLAASFAI